jgi:hypothetical protein
MLPGCINFEARAFQHRGTDGPGKLPQVGVQSTIAVSRIGTVTGKATV